MKRILIVEDDALVARIYRIKLQQEGYDVEVAVDGESALQLLASEPPDLVLLDLGLPTLSGVEVLKAIRSGAMTASLPVVVLSNSYVTAVVQAAWKAGANKCLSKASTTPRVLVDVVHGMMTAGPGPRPLRPGEAPESLPPPVRSAAEAAPAVPLVNTTDAGFQAEVRLALLSKGPGLLEDMRQRLKILAQSSGAVHALADSLDFYRTVHGLAGQAGSAGFTSIASLCAALEALLQELHDKPSRVGPSPIRTIAQAIDSLARLFEQERRPPTEEPAPPLILVLDDDRMARRTLCSALDKARLRSISVDDPLVALRLLEENGCDLIFSDVDMPGLNGFEFCAKVRTLPQHQGTPLVFVTSLADFDHRVRSTLSGGTDLIAKPFLLLELAVKALTYVLGRSRPPGAGTIP